MSAELIWLALAMILTFVGNIQFLIAAGRESALWLVVVALVPFGALGFLIKHWQTAKTGFIVGTIGFLCYVPSGIFSVVDGLLKNHNEEEIMQHYVARLRGNDIESVKQVKEDLAEKRFALEDAFDSYQATSKATKQSYTQLTQLRDTLDKNDQTAVKSFNEKAATYEQLNKTLAAKKFTCDRLKTELNELMEEKAALRKSNPRTASVASGGQVVIYSMKGCPPCVQAKQYFTRKGIPFVTYDVRNDQEAYQRFKALGGRGTPLVVINGATVHGYSPHRMDELLGR